MIPLAGESETDPARTWVEFVLVLLLATSIFKAFIVDGYFVPTGSMAPGLLGLHHRLTCPECGYAFDVGHDAGGWRPPSLVCPQCKHPGLTLADQIDQPGDRLLVLKGYFELFPPKRWETVVFLNPNDAGEAYVKRVVGLPRETISVRGGDIYANGQIARKTFEQYRAVALPVYDQRFASRSRRDANHWVVNGLPKIWVPGPAGWRFDGRSYRDRSELAFQDLSDTGRPTILRDDIPYNLTRLGGRSPEITDVGVSFELSELAGDGDFTVRLSPAVRHDFVLRLTPATGSLRIEAPGEPTRTTPIRWRTDRPVRVEWSFWDARLECRLDGQPVDGLDLSPIPLGFEPNLHPVSFEVQRLAGQIGPIEIYRDIYYRSEPPGSWPGREPQGIPLGKDEYCMFGDNSSVSNDSRSWDVPGISRRLFLGKPVLVHLPMRAERGKIAGRAWQAQWPDWSRFRRIDPW